MLSKLNTILSFILGFNFFFPRCTVICVAVVFRFGCLCWLKWASGTFTLTLQFSLSHFHLFIFTTSRSTFNYPRCHHHQTLNWLFENISLVPWPMFYFHVLSSYFFLYLFQCDSFHTLFLSLSLSNCSMEV